jgi:hypothetical protein
MAYIVLFRSENVIIGSRFLPKMISHGAFGDMSLFCFEAQ